MRPDILNPLFAETEALKGVGPTSRKPLERLGLMRAVDLAFHLPTGWVERVAVDRLDDAAPGQTIVTTLTPVSYKPSASPRGPFRVHATDRAGDHVSLVFFGGNPGWAKKLLPVGEPRTVSGKLESYGQERQIVHPEVAGAGEAAPPTIEPVYPLSEGLTSRRLHQLIEQALARAPDLPEWIEPSVLERRGWPGWKPALVTAHARADADRARAACL